MHKALLRSRPTSPNQFVEPSPATLGVHTLGLEHGRDGLIYVPPSYKPDRPSPLIICLHGAGSNGRNGLSLLEGFPTVDESATILLAPDSRGRTWDFIVGRDFGPDVQFIDRALDHVFKRYNVHPGHIGIAGFSDGASYALSIGIANGLFFSHILAFSPGFMRPPVHEDTPKIYMSHGTRDNVLPIDRCARPLAREIKRMGYPLVYREFNGGHTVPTDLAQEALDYLLDYGTHRSREEGDQKGRVFWAGVCQRVFHTRCCTVFSLS